jgi:hypothetical protein
VSGVSEPHCNKTPNILKTSKGCGERTSKEECRTCRVNGYE